MRGDERPRSLEPLAVEPDGQAAVGLLLDELVRAVVPDLDRAGAVVALRDLARERRVLERMILDVNGEVLLARLERHAFRHGPGGEHAVALEAEVVVQAPRVVPLHDEDRCLAAALPAKRFRRLLAVALALVLGEFLTHESYSYRSHDAYIVGDKPVDAVDSGAKAAPLTYANLQKTAT